jgi:hypothetical protein
LVGAEPRQSREVGAEPRQSREVGAEPRQSREVGAEPRQSREVGAEPRQSREVGAEPRHREVGAESRLSGESDHDRVKDGEEFGGREFAGTWRVEDSNGEPFEITLQALGAAEADRAGEGMSGTWDTDGASAVIVWDSGWTTKITRTGDSYTKTAYDTTAAAPTNTSPAEKVG